MVSRGQRSFNDGLLRGSQAYMAESPDSGACRAENGQFWPKIEGQKSAFLNYFAYLRWDRASQSLSKAVLPPDPARGITHP